MKPTHRPFGQQTNLQVIRNIVFLRIIYFALLNALFVISPAYAVPMAENQDIKITKPDLEKKGFKCKTLGLGGWECKKGDNKYYCVRGGYCKKAPTSGTQNTGTTERFPAFKTYDYRQKR